MSKYLKLFETTSQYETYMGGGEKILPNVSLIEETNKVEYNPYIPEMYIIYKATAKLSETTSSSSSGLHTNAFNTTIKSHTFENGVGTIEFDDSVTSIGNNAFRGCSSLTSITIPNSVTIIGPYVFSGCTSLPVEDNIRYADTYAVEAVDKTLSTYTIKNGTRFIGNNAFQGCTNLTSITIPDSVTSIGQSAFQGCTNLTSITIPDSVTSIGVAVFYECSNLVMIDVESGNTKYDSRDNCNAIVETATNTLIIGIQNTTIPNTVTSIGDYAFSYCINLTSIIIPDSVTSIGQDAFRGCSSLTSITIPNSVTGIGPYVFGFCTNLTSITIPNSVTSIGGWAFQSCTKLISVTVESTRPPSLGYKAFDYNAKGRKIYVPSASVNIYKSNWSTYASDIEAIQTA